METINKREAWNKGKLVGQKPPLKPKDIWAIRIYLQNAHAVRDLAMFNLAIDSKLRGCDLVSLRVRDITHGNQVLSRTMVIQKKNAAASAIRTDGTDEGGGVCLAGKVSSAQRSVPVSEQGCNVSPCIDAPTCTYRASLGRICRARLFGLRNAFHVKNEGDPDLQANKEPAGCSVTTWPFQAGEHRSLPRHRGRQCAGDFGAD